jgi:hypothetical protein
MSEYAEKLYLGEDDRSASFETPVGEADHDGPTGNAYPVKHCLFFETCFFLITVDSETSLSARKNPVRRFG